LHKYPLLKSLDYRNIPGIKPLPPVFTYNI
jgi:hypothetical protein